MKIKGTLFKNDRKTPGSNQPDYTGPGEAADGTKYRVAAWLKEKDGRKYLSWELDLPREAAPPAAGQPPLPAGPPTRQPATPATPAPTGNLAHIAAGDVDAGAPPPDDIPF